MAENYKQLYEQTKKMLTMYQDELIPGLRKHIEELEATTEHLRDRSNTAEDFICTMCTECKYEVDDGMLFLQKSCCSWFPECKKFKLRNWIPVSERLPNFSPNKWRKVIVTMEDDSGKRFTTTAIYNEKEKVWYAFADRRYENFKVLAWMIKPEVYDGN